jgi:hypothetical protein
LSGIKTQLVNFINRLFPYKHSWNYSLEAAKRAAVNVARELFDYNESITNEVLPETVLFASSNMSSTVSDVLGQLQLLKKHLTSMGNFKLADDFDDFVDTYMKEFNLYKYSDNDLVERVLKPIISKLASYSSDV